MADLISAALSPPGIGWVFAIIFVAGLVYGFAGFGAALIAMPVITHVLPPEVAVGAFSFSALASFATVVPRAWGQADRPLVLRMIAVAVLATPLGVWLLRVADDTVLRAAISVIVLATLALLLSGWRFRVPPGAGAQAAVGAASGVFGGATGLNGPVVILFNLGAGLPVAMVRANTTVFLTLCSLAIPPQLWLQGLIAVETLVLGLMMLVPYGLGTVVGAWAFRPEAERPYRVAAYTIIAAAGLAGLPVWG